MQYLKYKKNYIKIYITFKFAKLYPMLLAVFDKFDKPMFVLLISI